MFTFVFTHFYYRMDLSFTIIKGYIECFTGFLLVIYRNAELFKSLLSR